MVHSLNCIKFLWSRRRGYFAPAILRPLACCARGQLPPPSFPRSLRHWSNPQQAALTLNRRPATSQGSHWEKFQMTISPQRVVRSTSCLVLRWGFRGRRFRQIQDGSSWLEPPSWDIQIAISQRRIIRFTPCLVPARGFRGRQIEWRYFRFDQIQYACRKKKQCARSNSHMLLAEKM